mmetsp:Transcript_9155/g.13851  ORF Transcript_9155/g.13851 Transcript_9155/m.13851 type:complete len:238 (-) Transcript_9155:113-826(-)
MFRLMIPLRRNSDNQRSLPDIARDKSGSDLSVGGTNLSMIESYRNLPTIDETHDQTVASPPSLQATLEDGDCDSLSTVSPISFAGRSKDFISFRSESGDDIVADLQSLSGPFSIVFHDDDDDISMSSINTEALKELKDLRTRLRMQEDTKMELLQQLQKKITNDVFSMETTSMLYMKAIRKENNKMRDASAKMELEFMNEMAAMETSIRKKDDRIVELEEELRVLKLGNEENNRDDS